MRDAIATPCPVPDGLDPILSCFDFADSFAVAVPKERFDAISAARLAFGTSPSWVKALLKLRNMLVAPFGLTGTPPEHPAGRIGWFPVMSQDARRVVMGLDDRHLDFRIVLDHVPAEAQDIIRATTLVKRHNLGGRLYLATILPFHKRIVPVMLRALNAAQ